MNFFLKVKEFGELLTFKSHKKKTRLIYIHIFCLALLIIYDIIDCFFNLIKCQSIKLMLINSPLQCNLECFGSSAYIDLQHINAL